MIEFEQQQDVCFVKGELTSLQVTQLWQKRTQLFTASTQVVDLSALDYADSAGIAFILALIGIHQRSNNSNVASGQVGRITLANPSPQVAKMMELYDLEDFYKS